LKAACLLARGSWFRVLPMLGFVPSSASWLNVTEFAGEADSQYVRAEGTGRAPAFQARRERGLRFFVP